MYADSEQEQVQAAAQAGHACDSAGSQHEIFAIFSAVCAAGCCSKKEDHWRTEEAASAGVPGLSEARSTKPLESYGGSFFNISTEVLAQALFSRCRSSRYT